MSAYSRNQANRAKYTHRRAHLGAQRDSHANGRMTGIVHHRVLKETSGTILSGISLHPSVARSSLKMFLMDKGSWRTKARGRKQQVLQFCETLIEIRPSPPCFDGVAMLNGAGRSELPGSYNRA